MTDWACPGCGAGEAVHHADGCTMRPWGVRDCCGTAIYPGIGPTHEAWCGWADGPGPVPGMYQLSRYVWNYPDRTWTGL